MLQHLSNKEIKEIVSKLYDYKYVILTEHLPIGEFEANKDIISGQGIRIKKQSGIDLLKAPFHLRVTQKKELLQTKLEQNRGVIETVLYTL